MKIQIKMNLMMNWSKKVKYLMFRLWLKWIIKSNYLEEDIQNFYLHDKLKFYIQRDKETNLLMYYIDEKIPKTEIIFYGLLYCF